jgi:hypothetical protein
MENNLIIFYVLVLGHVTYLPFYLVLDSYYLASKHIHAGIIF